MTTRSTRADDSRTATSRLSLGGERGRLDIDISSLPKNLVPTWIREETRGEMDDDNVQSAQERGYVPVLTSDLPSYKKFARLPGARKDVAEDELIRRGGMVLMARERHIDREERDIYSQQTKGAIKSVARDLAAQRDGTNVKDLPDSVVRTTVQRADSTVGRFSEPD